METTSMHIKNKNKLSATYGPVFLCVVLSEQLMKRTEKIILFPTFCCQKVVFSYNFRKFQENTRRKRDTSIGHTYCRTRKVEKWCGLKKLKNSAKFSDHGIFRCGWIRLYSQCVLYVEILVLQLQKLTIVVVRYPKHGSFMLMMQNSSDGSI